MFGQDKIHNNIPIYRHEEINNCILHLPLLEEVFVELANDVAVMAYDAEVMDSDIILAVGLPPIVDTGW